MHRGLSESEKPEYLLHFTRFENLKNILKSKCLWIQTPHNMNDPLELLYFNNMLLKHYQSDPDIFPILKKRLNEYCGQDSPAILDAQYFLLCLSNISKPTYAQWAYYADRGEGVSLKINIKNLVEPEIKMEGNYYHSRLLNNSFSEFQSIPGGHLAYLAQVVYCEEFPAVLNELVKKLGFSQNEDEFDINRNRPLIKSMDFEHEKEVRLIIIGNPKEACEKGKGKFQFVQGCGCQKEFTPRWEIPLLYQDKFCIDSIQLGPKFFEKHCVFCLKEIDQIMKQNFELHYDQNNFFNFSENLLMPDDKVEAISEKLRNNFSQELADKFRQQTFGQG